MPSFIPRKRRHSDTQDAPAPKSLKKDSLFDAVDSPAGSATLQDHKRFPDCLNDAEGSLSELSETSEPDFGKEPSNHVENENDDDDEEQGWEDAIYANAVRQEERSEDKSGDIILDLQPDAHAQFISSNPYGKKKGPTKVERQMRVASHCMHVQFLLFHNLIRNAWCCDKEAQHILVSQLPDAVKKEVDRWRARSGIELESAPDPLPSSFKGKHRRKPDTLIGNERNQRDWGMHAEKQEKGVPNLSRGDPLIRLLKVLASYWKKKFKVTASGLRKRGYKPLAVLASEISSFKHEEHDPEKHGERVLGVHHFRHLAKTCEGSRDVGAQLFTTLVRGLGIEARLVASLQPVGYGWSKGEEALDVGKKMMNSTRAPAEHSENLLKAATDSDAQSVSAIISAPRELMKSKLPERRSPGDRRAQKRCALLQVSNDSKTSSVGSGPHSGDSDDQSLRDLTPSSPQMKRSLHFDRDMLFPTYWTEAVSPITSDVFPVDAFLLSPAVATCEDHLAAFEPRGAKAEKAKQVIAYIVGYSMDGTAKDITARYLRRHIWPGRTKGVRLPVEKVAVYNKKGKIRHYEDYDWFKTAISGYMRTSDMRTAVDDLEEAKDLKPVERHKKESKEGRETLQSYKTSADFVLERHLRREEAILPGSKPVKTFLTGKGENAKEEPVYKRKDVAICRTGESWHKEGRQVKAGEQPIKMVPVRAVTLTRKREVEEAERAGGEKIKQGLYALSQTDWIIPPPIQDGIIPKNAFGNIDCYVPTMIPEGAVHIPLKSTSKICKRLNIDFAEACTGFEFGNQRAVPVITGVVVATEHKDIVIAEWEKDEVVRKAKEEGKQERIVLAMWRKLLTGLKIMKRVEENYGGDTDGNKREDINPFTNKRKSKSAANHREDLETPADPRFLGDAKHIKGESLDDTLEKLRDNEDGLPTDVNHHKYIGENDSAFTGIEGGGFIIEHDDSSHETRATAHLDPTPEREVQAEHIKNLSSKLKPALPSQEHYPQAKKGPISSTKKVSNNGTPPKSKSNPARIQKKPLQQTFTHRPTPSNSKVKATASASASSSTKSGTPSGRTAPKRAAAIHSEKAVKSHYFAHDSDNDDDDDDDDDNGNSSETSKSESDAEQPYYQPAVAQRRRGRPTSMR